MPISLSTLCSRDGKLPIPYKPIGAILSIVQELTRCLGIRGRVVPQAWAQCLDLSCRADTSSIAVIPPLMLLEAN